MRGSHLHIHFVFYLLPNTLHRVYRRGLQTVFQASMYVSTCMVLRKYQHTSTQEQNSETRTTAPCKVRAEPSARPWPCRTLSRTRRAAQPAVAKPGNLCQVLRRLRARHANPNPSPKATRHTMSHSGPAIPATMVPIAQSCCFKVMDAVPSPEKASKCLMPSLHNSTMLRRCTAASSPSPRSVSALRLCHSNKPARVAGPSGHERFLVSFAAAQAYFMSCQAGKLS